MAPVTVAHEPLPFTCNPRSSAIHRRPKNGGRLMDVLERAGLLVKRTLQADYEVETGAGGGGGPTLCTILVHLVLCRL